MSKKCAVTRWSRFWQDSTIMFITDSAMVEAALKTGRSHSKGIMGYMRKLIWAAVEYNFEFKAIYIKSKDNVVCDSLSRLEESGSRDRIRGVDNAGTIAVVEYLISLSDLAVLQREQ